MNLISRIKAKTPRKDKVHGQLSTIVTGAVGTILMMDLFHDPYMKAGLILIGGIFGGKTFYHAIQVKK